MRAKHKIFALMALYILTPFCSFAQSEITIEAGPVSTARKNSSALKDSASARQGDLYQRDGRTIISRDIYGQFAEHLGHGIYEGLWVGLNSSVANTRGIRNDVVTALKAAKIPLIRWPGGCFADEYHWMDGIGPSDADFNWTETLMKNGSKFINGLALHY